MNPCHLRLSSFGWMCGRFRFFAIFFLLGGFVSVANATSLSGRWSLEGVPSPSGTSTAMASIKESPDGGCELTLPPDLQPAVGAQSIALAAKGHDVYSARTTTGAEVTLTITKPGRAHLSIAGKSAFSRFEVLLRKVDD